jgi:hypothetical protein
MDDINGLLQIAVYAQVEMNRIVDRLNQLNGCESQTDCGWGKPTTVGSDEDKED